MVKLEYEVEYRIIHVGTLKLKATSPQEARARASKIVEDDPAEYQQGTGVKRFTEFSVNSATARLTAAEPAPCGACKQRLVLSADGAWVCGTKWCRGVPKSVPDSDDGESSR